MTAVPEVITLLILALAVGAEVLHHRRVQSVAPLAFASQLSWLGKWNSILRVLFLTGLTWALATLFFLPPKTHAAKKVDPKEIKHVVLVLDVSPSMKLTDAGPEMKEARSHRVAELLQSFFQRVPMEQIRLSVIATYTGAKPVVVDTKDVGVVRNILDGLPLDNAFETGQTDLFAGIKVGVQIAQPWPRHSTTLIILSDGDTIPATGLPDLPPSISHAVCIGVGDTRAGQFIDGRHSRQDAATMKQLATRLKGVYHDGNQKHLPTELLKDITTVETEGRFARLTRRDYALFILATFAPLLVVLPWALQRFGSRHRPGRV